MPDQPKQTGPMKPAMPEVPGVEKPVQKDAGGLASQLDPTTRMVIGIGAFLVVGGLIAYFALRPAQHSSKNSRFAAVESGHGKKTAPGDVQPTDTPRRPVGIATTADLAEPWSSKPFYFHQSLTGTTVPALIIRLPEGAAGETQSYWAFSMIEAFGSCQLEYITDLNRISAEYGFRARHPMVVNPCKHAVYDPLQMASLPTGAWARGAIVHGSALRPPMAIDIRIEGDQIIPVQIE